MDQRTRCPLWGWLRESRQVLRAEPLHELPGNKSVGEGKRMSLAIRQQSGIKVSLTPRPSTGKTL